MWLESIRYLEIHGLPLVELGLDMKDISEPQILSKVFMSFRPKIDLSSLSIEEQSYLPPQAGSL